VAIDGDVRPTGGGAAWPDSRKFSTMFPVEWCLVSKEWLERPGPVESLLSGAHLVWERSTDARMVHTAVQSSTDEKVD
jgi:hypothetical protein